MLHQSSLSRSISRIHLLSTKVTGGVARFASSRAHTKGMRAITAEQPLNGNFLDGDEIEHEEEAPMISHRENKKMGLLQSILPVPPPKEQLASALKRAAKVAYTSAIKNETEKERNRAARQMDCLWKELSVPLTKYLSGFPPPQSLQPYDLALLQLTIGESNYTTIISKVDTLRKGLQETGKAYAARANKAVNKSSAMEIAVEGLERLTAFYNSGAKNVEALREVGRKLRSLPLVELNLPTLALVGAPNVGKSSLVQMISTGIPEICNYPFTTRSIKMGHFFIDGRKNQVTDTPGLLSRKDEERNKMEMLTLAVLQYLPTSVLFVIDLTEECGTSVEEQWIIRQEVKERFPDKAWVDVFSKQDVVDEILKDGLELRAVLKSDCIETVKRPEEVVAMLPDALAVSSLTEEGILDLKEKLMKILEEQRMREQSGWEQSELEGRNLGEGPREIVKLGININ